MECICINYKGQNGLCNIVGHKEEFEKITGKKVDTLKAKFITEVLEYTIDSLQEKLLTNNK